MQTCNVPRCRAESVMTYLGRDLCAHHWRLLCSREAQLEALGSEVVADAILADILNRKEPECGNDN